MKSSPTNMDYARSIEAHGALDVAITISKAISLIDVSKTARSASGDEMGDAYLNDARTMLLGLIGIEVEEPSPSTPSSPWSWSSSSRSSTGRGASGDTRDS